MTSLARLLHEIYFSGVTHYATGGVDAKGDVFYTPTEGIPELELIEKHIAGEAILGAYIVLPGNYARVLAFDVDSKKEPEKAKEITAKIHSYLGKIPHAISWSGGKGYHVNVYFNRVNSAKEVKKIGEDIRDILGLPKSGDPHIEVFPKQCELTESHPLGSLIRLPLGIHPKTRNQSRFVDPDSDWETVSAEVALNQRADIADLDKRLDAGGELDKLAGKFTPYWDTGQRHDMALYTSGYMANLDWTEEAVQELIERIHDLVGTGDLDDWLRTVRDTFSKVYAGKKVIGLSGLAQIIPSAVMQEITEIASKQVFSATLKSIDAIRLSKQSSFHKVRLAAKAIISFFRENGKLVRDANDTYWLDDESKNLLKFAGADWDRFAHNEFGLNSAESFGKQTNESVKHLAYEEAEVVQVHKRFHWNDDSCYINLGGPEVYVLDGKEIKLAYNGENKILFMNSTDPMRLPNLLELDIEPISPWSFLVDGLNFAPGESVSASPVQQREMFKAYILSICFAEELPTRPILTLLAAPASGKTTAARNVLRLMEAPYEEVSQVLPDKPDALRSSMEAHKVIVLDNLEKTKAPWLTDVLNRASTGSNMELRVLHTTNTMRNVKLDNFIMITATNMPFTEETVFTRILPIQLIPVTSFRSEHQMNLYIWKNYNALWKGLLIDLNKVVAELKSNRSVEVPVETRLADFSVFCNRIKGADFINGEELMKGLSGLVSRQKDVLAETSTFIQIFELWDKTRNEDSVKWMFIAELYSIMQRFATTHRIEFVWTSAQGFAKHILMLEPKLTQFYGLSTKKVIESGREQKMYRFEKKQLTH